MNAICINTTFSAGDSCYVKECFQFFHFFLYYLIEILLYYIKNKSKHLIVKLMFFYKVLI